MSHMEITRVSAGIGNTTIVHDINFTITPGTMTALVGVNGAGHCWPEASRNTPTW